ncbi:Psychrophilic metalloprotease Fpp2 precursor [Flavobacterium indicum GPTSA100-9 = DSM 17447]|uniref:Psychrophilic metalloprotease Fpp2 n=1 Tax=Flavobacterium indicum (strain DSM 17447 / CIP 109464 / GPTSA100-9) TaxID=1094466 RepID=H8XRB4_FLAIG|nr:T9SS type A sorting domain-containing protein [Flavobacterium indicum]CCG54348.1 Psychrophilic metalloprotease Fpp2 precursor [Flavobacterium indicum GPTSA100-9 = DSM 17447]
MRKITLLALMMTTFISFGQNKNNGKVVFGKTISPELISPSGHIRCASTEYLASKQEKGTAVSNEIFEQWLAPKVEEIRKMRKARMLPSVIRIPVVVHIIHNGDAVGVNENIPDGQVLSQITVFNQDFRRLIGTPGYGAGVDTTIEFCMAVVDPNGNPTNGIDRKNLGIASFGQAQVEAAKASTIWDPTKYLNLWTFNFGGDLAGVLGYAQFPSGSGLAGMPQEDCITGEASTDGVVCNYGTWGSRTIFPAGNYSDTTYDKGRTMTHEVGHMLGLRHIWGDDGCTSTTNNYTTEDFCADTPVAAAANFGCATGTDSCPLAPGNDQVENYMDYSDDACMNMFTQDQKDRLLAVLMNSPRRDDLLVSTVCSPQQASIQFKRMQCEQRLTNTDVLEGNGCGYTEYTAPVSINKAPTANAVVTFSIDGTSQANANDIQIVTPTLTFNAGSTTDQNFVFRVYKDKYVETDENLVITFTVNANGGDAFANAEGNKLSLTIKNDDTNPTTSTTTNLISEDFESATDWTVLDGDGDTRNWGIVTGANGVGTAPNTIQGKCAYSEKSLTYLGGTGNATPNNYMISPQITIPTGITSATLTYIIAGYGATAGNYTVYFATNVSSAANINSGTVLQTSTTIGSNASVLRNHSLLALAGQTGYIVFRHSNLNSASGLLLLDTVNLDVVSQTNVQTAVNNATSGTNNLIGSGTGAFYDSASRNIMTNINVTSNTNFGCTSVAVTRAGTGALQYGTSANVLDYAMSKQFTITPATTTTGTATITFYFTEAEIAGWEAATSNNRASLYVVRDGLTREVMPVTIGSFGTNVTLTATFSNGIDGVYSFARLQSLPSESFELNDLVLYPNPNNGVFNLQFVPSSNSIAISVFDIRGRVVYDKTFENNGLFNENISLNNVETGVYIVKIQDGNKKTVRRIIVDK